MSVIASSLTILMIFAEKKTENGFCYELEEVFGKVTLDSKVKLDGASLDAIVLGLMHNQSSEGNIGEKIKYKFERRSQWEEIEEAPEACDCDIPEKRESLFTKAINFIKRLWPFK
jgi:hypothetical protein